MRDGDGDCVTGDGMGMGVKSYPCAAAYTPQPCRITLNTKAILRVDCVNVTQQFSEILQYRVQYHRMALNPNALVTIATRPAQRSNRSRAVML